MKKRRHFHVILQSGIYIADKQIHNHDFSNYKKLIIRHLWKFLLIRGFSNDYFGKKTIEAEFIYLGWLEER